MSNKIYYFHRSICSFRTFVALVAPVNLFFLAAITNAQYKNIKISDTISSYEPEECTIVINPSNTNNIMAASNTNHYYFSTDAGLTWQHGSIQSPFGVIGDPVVAAGANGKYYYFHLVNDLSRVVCHKLSNMGGTWTEGTYTGVNGTKQNDKDWGTINVKNNYLYVAWSQFDRHGSSNPLDSSVVLLSRSTDEGSTWSIPTQISNKKGNAQGGNYSAHCPMPAIGPNNDVYVTWMGPDGLMFDKSTDGGVTWNNKDINVTPYHINWLVFNISDVQRIPNFPVIICDLSSSIYNGNIYISWADQRNGSNNTDVWLSKSTNGGLTWSSSKRVNSQDDAPGAHQFFPWMTVDQVTGYIYFIYYDRSNYTDNRTDVMMAYSKDGGETFHNFLISETPFIPTQATFMGDYIGISAHNNIVRPIWTRVDNGRLSLWTAIADPISSLETDSKNIRPSDFEILSVYPNPFNPSTKISYKLPTEGIVSLKVFDLLGKKVATLVDEFQTAENYEVDWNAGTLVSGIYFIQLQFENRIKTQKIILSK